MKTRTSFETALSRLPGVSLSQDERENLLAEFKSLFEKASPYVGAKEEDVRAHIIDPALGLLGYEHYTTEFVQTIQGKMLRADYLLCADKQTVSAAINFQKKAGPVPSADKSFFLEAKGWDVELDNGKLEAKGNPYQQLVTYLQVTRRSHGMLCNGHTWMYVDNSEVRREKSCISFNLREIAQSQDIEQFSEFLKLFLLEPDHFSKSAELEQQQDRLVTMAENDLQELMYGSSTIVEKIARILHAAFPEESLSSIYDNTIFLLFRMIFIAFFESRYDSVLSAHEKYPEISLRRIFKGLTCPSPDRSYRDLLELFDILDKGKPLFKIPLLNGGLFKEERAPLLGKNFDLIGQEDLRSILSDVLYYKNQNEGAEGLRDYSLISVSHLGRIYEGLLKFSLRETGEKSVTYIKYKESGKAQTLEGYFDGYDEGLLEKTKGVTITEKGEPLPPGAIYFVSSSYSRKQSASYYTPQEITDFMVRKGIESALAKMGDEPDVLSLKILDSSCGSGDFLIAALSALTQHVSARLEALPRLRAEVASEKEKIQAQYDEMQLSYPIDEHQLLKRILLKRCIFGVDISPFAVEITRMSLWLDTFIFGTPLSIIEHHIKTGNTLLGLSEKEIREKGVFDKGDALFAGDALSELREKVTEMSRALSRVADTTAQEIASSKQALERVSEQQARLRRLYSLALIHVLSNEKPIGPAAFGLSAEELTEILEPARLLSGEPLGEAGQRALGAAQSMQFFCPEVEFPESAGEGFDLVIGNPPWDKVKFTDADFAARYDARFRSRSDAGRREKLCDLLLDPQKKRFYESEKSRLSLEAAMYKALYPLNRGPGDTNLFRLFMEKSLSMLAERGSLVYLTPSAWTYEDGSLMLRKEIVTKHQLRFMYQFENKGIFKDIHSSFKWAISQIEPLGDGQTPEAPQCLFMQRDLGVLGREEEAVSCPLSYLQKTSPHYYAFWELRSEKDKAVIEKMYSAGAPLQESQIGFYRELDMTSDKVLFQSAEKSAPGDMFLYEGKHIHQYDSRRFERSEAKNEAAKFRYVSPEAYQKRLQSKYISRMIGDLSSDLSRALGDRTDFYGSNITGKTKTDRVLQALKLSSKEELAPCIAWDYAAVRLAFREIARNTDQRTLISALLPPGCVAGNTLYLHHPFTYSLKGDSVQVSPARSLKELLLLMANVNSLALDYLARRIVEIHVNRTYFYRLPFLAWEGVDETVKESVALSAASVSSYYNPDLEKPFKEGGITARPAATEKEAQELQGQIDAEIARLYGISRGEMLYMLEDFTALRERHPEQWKLARDQAKRLPE